MTLVHDSAQAEREAEHAEAAAPPARAAVARGLSLALSALGLGTFAWTVALRVASPFPLEWMEGASLHHALRLLAGEPLYAAPSADFIPYLYPPLAYLPWALAAAWFGPSLPAARAVSLACSVLSMLCIGRAAARAAGRPLAGLAAAGLFAVGFGYTGAFLDLVRVDACFVLLVALAADRVLESRPHAALVCLALSAFAKQHGMLLLAALSFALLAQAPRVHARAVALVWGALGATAAGLELATSGWFGRYVLALPLAHGAEPVLFFSFFAVDVLLYLPVLALAAGASIVRRGLTPFDALLLAALLAGALGRAHAGGHDNVRLPAFALLCIAGIAPLCRALLETRKAGVRSALAAALALQFALLWQAPSFHAPPNDSARRFAALRAALGRCARSGRAVALDHALLAGEPFLHTMALSDLRMAEGTELGRRGTRVLLEALSGPSAPSAVAVGESFPALERVLAQHYAPCVELPAPIPATGHVPSGRDAHGRRVQRVYTRIPEKPP